MKDCLEALNKAITQLQAHMHTTNAPIRPREALSKFNTSAPMMLEQLPTNPAIGIPTPHPLYATDSDVYENMKRHETNTLGITSGTIVKVLDLYNEFTKRKVMSSADWFSDGHSNMNKCRVLAAYTTIPQPEASIFCNDRAHMMRKTLDHIRPQLQDDDGAVTLQLIRSDLTMATQTRTHHALEAFLQAW